MHLARVVPGPGVFAQIVKNGQAQLALPVGAGAQHGRIPIGHRHQGPGRVAVQTQALRIPAAVHALMVILHRPQPQRVAHTQAVQHLHTSVRVLAHQRALLFIQRRRLAQRLAQGQGPEVV